MACAQPNRSLFLRVADADCTSWAGWSGGQPSAWLDHPTATVRKGRVPCWVAAMVFLRAAPSSAGGKVSQKIRSAPWLFRVMGRPNSPPPELLNHRVRFAPLDVNPTFVPLAGTKWLYIPPPPVFHTHPIAKDFEEWDRGCLRLDPWLLP